MRSLDLMATQGRINQADISTRNQQLETNRALIGKFVYSLFDVNDSELLIFVSCCLCDKLGKDEKNRITGSIATTKIDVTRERELKNHIRL